jgi:hypothetical protein
MQVPDKQNLGLCGSGRVVRGQRETSYRLGFSAGWEGSHRLPREMKE